MDFSGPSTVWCHHTHTQLLNIPGKQTLRERAGKRGFAGSLQRVGNQGTETQSGALSSFIWMGKGFLLSPSFLGRAVFASGVRTPDPADLFPFRPVLSLHRNINSCCRQTRTWLGWGLSAQTSEHPLGTDTHQTPKVLPWSC